MKQLLLINSVLVTVIGCSPVFADQIRIPVDAIPVITVEDLDYVTLEEGDINREVAGLPSRFAFPTAVSITPASHGIWEKLDGDKMRWTCRVACDNALTMNIGFGKYNMPPSGSMIIMDPTDTYRIRPFTSQDNKDHGELWTPVILSNEIVIEITVDQAEKQDVSRNIELTSINAGYRWFRETEERGSSESCNVDVLCATGDNWWDEIPSVGVYTVSGWWTCTGAMINNTAEDQTPYFLTANHCGVTSASDASIVVYWNHQNSFCRTGSASGNAGNGSYAQFTSGSTMRATRSYSDFTLTELSSNPNAAWGITYSGWSRASSTYGVGAGIHHPETAEKRISIPDYSTASGEYWNVNWSIGRTAPGSSGSPLYDSNHRIVGQLCCGSSYCWNDYNDYYGRSISLSWNGGSSSSLNTWLDPLGTGQTSIDTLNPATAPIGACCVGTSGACLNIHESNCIAGGGTYLGDDTVCADGGCDPSCPTDLDGNGYTDVTDLLEVVAQWGATGSQPADINGDGVVGVADLLAIIEAWGPC